MASLTLTIDPEILEAAKLEAERRQTARDCELLIGRLRAIPQGLY